MFDRANYKPYSFRNMIEEYLEDYKGIIAITTLGICLLMLLKKEA